MDKIRDFFKDMWKYLQEVWIEVRPQKGRVAWPNWDNITMATKVVIISSLGIGAFIGFFDIILSEILKYVIGTKG